MADRFTANQKVQIGVEATAGTAVAATKQLLSLGISPAIKADVQSFKPMGTKYGSIAALNQESVEAKIAGIPVFDELQYLLASLINYAAPAQQGATTAYKWLFESLNSGPDTLKTLTVEQGDTVRGHRFAFGSVSDLKFSFDNKGVSLDGKMLGKALEDPFTMTAAGVTSLPQIPLLRSQIDLYIADTAAGLAGAAALTRGWSAEWSLGDRLKPMNPLGSANGASFAAVAENNKPKLQAKIFHEADASGMGLLTKLRAGTTQFLRIKCEGATISGAYKYLFQIDFAGKVMGTSEFKDADGVFAIEYNLDGVYDPTWTKAYSISLINTQSAL
jgi:hypothetical protein